jgi:hypothetical protein
MIIHQGGWIRIDVDTFVYTVRTLRETVLRNTPSTFNLNNLTVRITKPESQRWLHLCPHLINTLISDEVRESDDLELISEAKRLGVQRYFDRPLHVTLRLCIEYALPETASAAPLLPSALQMAAFGGCASSSSGGVKSGNSSNNNNGNGMMTMSNNGNNNNNNSGMGIMMSAK